MQNFPVHFHKASATSLNPPAWGYIYLGGVQRTHTYTHTWRYVHRRMAVCVRVYRIVVSRAAFVFIRVPVRTTGKNGAANGWKNARGNGRLRDYR